LPGALEAFDAILQSVDGGTLTAPEASSSSCRRRFSCATRVGYKAGAEDNEQGDWVSDATACSAGLSACRAYPDE